MEEIVQNAELRHKKPKTPTEPDAAPANEKPEDSAPKTDQPLRRELIVV